MNSDVFNVSGSETGEITAWWGNLQNDKAAAEGLWRHFFPRLVGFAEPQMQQMPSKARDEEDVALSALDSLFAAADSGRFDVKSRVDLWRLLVTITYRKITNEKRRQFAKKRGGGVEHIGNHSGDDSLDPISDIIDPNLMPEFVKDVHANCNELLEALPDEATRVTAQMKLDGCSNDEICDLLHCKPHETKARLKRIRSLWRQYLEEQN